MESFLMQQLPFLISSGFQIISTESLFCVHFVVWQWSCHLTQHSVLQWVKLDPYKAELISPLAQISPIKTKNKIKFL